MRKYLKLISNGVRYGFLSIPGLIDGDKLDNITATEQKADRDNVEEETGWDRIQQMFTVDEFGNVSQEANSILQVGCMSIFVGGIYGGVLSSRGAFLEFMKNNEATSFKSHLDAKRKLQDKVTISFGKGAFRWGWRITLFSTSFVGISTMIQVYKNDYGIMEYVIAGGLSGMMYKFNMGPRGWIVAGGLGSVLGFICGCATTGLLKLMGISMKEARYWQYQWKRSRLNAEHQARLYKVDQEDYAIIKLHDEAVGEAGRNILNLNQLEDKNKNNVANK